MPRTNLIENHHFKLILFSFLVVLLFSVSCFEEPEDEKEKSVSQTPPPAVTGLFSTDRDAGFFDAPFPIEHMRRGRGTIKYDLLENPDNNPLVQHYIDLANKETNGFSRAGVIYIPFNGPVDESNLPKDVFDSLKDGSKVFLVNVDFESDNFGQKIPIHVKWHPYQTTYRPGNLLMLLPYQGYPMEANTMYAAVVLADLGDIYGRELAQNDTLDIMRQGDVPDGQWGWVNTEAFRHLWEYMDYARIGRRNVATAAVFRTGDFVWEMKALRKAIALMDDPMPLDIKVIAEYENFYIIEGKIIVPIWQNGQRPYWDEGGEIHFDNNGPVIQWYEQIRFAVSVPKDRPMPEAGFPMLLYANGQGGTYTQIFDRGGVGDAANVPGTGPGREFANRGIACLDIEAALSGPRHPTGSYAGLEFFNFINLVAFRDNIRQAASEFSMLVKMVNNLIIPAELVPDADIDGDVIFDPENIFFWGHSTGASIGALAMAVEPRIKGGMVSGAGVSWIYNLTMKLEPIPLAPTIDYFSGAEDFDEFHPLALMFQNICDPAEAAYFARHWTVETSGIRPALNSLIIMGVFDRYFPPAMIDGLIVASQVDVAEPLVYEPTLDALELSGGKTVSLPASLNNQWGSTSLAIQFQADLGVDGHYSPFYFPEAKYQYTCFFESLAKTGTATLPLPKSDAFAPCEF